MTNKNIMSMVDSLEQEVGLGGVPVQGGAIKIIVEVIKAATKILPDIID